MKRNVLDEVANQIGEEALRKSIGDIGLGQCSVHGRYTFDTSLTSGNNPGCPICPKANGTSATEVEHYINIREAVGQDGSNPQQRYGV